jgi:hypothetical protein
MLARLSPAPALGVKVTPTTADLPGSMGRLAGACASEKKPPRWLSIFTSLSST